MDFDLDVWGRPLVVLGAAVLVGIALALRSRAAPAVAAAVGSDRTNLEARHQAAVTALRDLEFEREKLAPADYEAQKKALLADGAAALRALEAAPGAPSAALSEAALAVLDVEKKRLGDAAFADALARLAPGAARPAALPAASGMAGEWKGALYATSLFVLLGALAWSAGDIAKPRRDGGGMNGGPSAGASAPAAPRVDTAELEARVAKDPNDLEALNRLTMAAMQNRDPAAAMKWSDKALAVAPKDDVARLNRALMTAEMGMADAALAKIDEVLADSPAMPEANLYKGLLLMMSDKSAEAVPFLEKAIALGMDSPAVRQALQEAKGAGAPVASAPGAAPGGPGSDQVVISGTITLDPAAEAAVKQAATVYVSVKNGAGPPVAAKKLPVGPFPMQFTVTMADRPPMMGDRPVPDTFDVTVRADLDGNAMTKDPTEAVVVLPGIKNGATGLSATLSPPAP